MTAARDLGKEIANLKRAVAALQRGAQTAQLRNSSIVNGSLKIVGPAGEVTWVGTQKDGKNAVVTEAAPPPPIPAGLTLTPGPLALTAAWDGTFEGGLVRPSDFDHVEIHLATALATATASGDTDGTYLVCADADATDVQLGDTVRISRGDTAVDNLMHTVTLEESAFGFTNIHLDPPAPALLTGDVLQVIDVGAATRMGTLNRAGSMTISPLEEVVHHAVLVAVNTSGTKSAASNSVAATPGPAVAPGTITETEIADDSISSPKIQTEALIARHFSVDSVLAGAIAAGQITAEHLEAVLQLVNKLIAGDPATTRIEIDPSGIIAYVSGAADDGSGDAGDAVITFNLSTLDGSLSIVGELKTDVDGNGWAVGQNGIWVTPGADLTYGPVGNPGQQVAWGDGAGNTAAYLEARTDLSLWLQNNLGNVLIGTGPGAWVHVVGPDTTSGNLQVDGLMLGRLPVKRVEGDRADLSWSAASDVYGTIVTGLNNATVDSGDITFDAATNALVAPYTGSYDLYGSLVWSANSSGYRYLELFNLTQQKVLVSTRDPASTSFLDQSISTIAGLNAGDKIQLRAYQVTSPAVSLGRRTSGTDATAAPPAALGMAFRGWATVGVPPQPPDGGGGDSGGGSSGNTQQTLTVNTASTHSYQWGSVNAWRSNGGDVYQGNYGFGNHLGCFFYGAGAFDALAGKTVDKITMWLHRKSSGGDAGKVQPNLTGHDYLATPGNNNSPSYGTDGSNAAAFGRLPGMAWGEQFTAELPVEVGQALADGTIKGLAFVTDGDSYGIWYSHAQTADGMLTITYH